MTMLQRLKQIFKSPSEDNCEEQLLENYDRTKKEFDELILKTKPRICVVKQDINEDLYCCHPSNDAKEIIGSTLLRTGPAALFAKHHAHFKIVRTEDDAECEIWKQRATELKWDTLEFFQSYQQQIPGREYGQQQIAVNVEDVDWSEFDIVISIDNSIPERICRKYPDTLWCYYVREIKTQAYRDSLEKPLPGQDCVLNHQFRIKPDSHKPHVLNFPYHLHYLGCFHDIFGSQKCDDLSREGVFVDHHTMVTLSAEQRTTLKMFGVATSPIHEQGDREIIPTSEKLARRTVDSDLLSHFLQSRFFLMTSGQRRVFGTAVVEAIAMGALVIGTDDSMQCQWLVSKQTKAKNFDHAIFLMDQLNNNQELYLQELTRQRKMVNHLCYHRPMIELLQKLEQKRSMLYSSVK